jgi:hypothetical protein
MEVNVNPEEEAVTPVEEVHSETDLSTTTDESVNVNVVVPPPETGDDEVKELEEKLDEHHHPELEAKLDAILAKLETPEPAHEEVVDETKEEETGEEEPEGQFESPGVKKKSWLYGVER